MSTLSRSARGWTELGAHVVLLLIGLGGMQVAAERTNRRIDLTPGRALSLAPATRKLLAEVTAPLRITVFFRRGTRERHADLVRLFADANPRIAFELLDLDRFPERARSLGVTSYGRAAIEYGARRAVVLAAPEEEVAGGIRRVVHLSSMAVHGYRFPEVLTEEFPLTTGGDAYSMSKAEGETLAFAIGAAKGVEIVALRPSLVYGPRSPYWVVSYFERTKNEQITLIDGGAGLANLVWVDDVVEAMITAWQHPAAAGEAFLISGEHPVTWREYIGRFAEMCGVRVCAKVDPPSVQ